MYTVTKFPHGTFSWADLISTDQAKSRAFYEAVMGWETEDVPMGAGQNYTFFKVDGHRVAAVGPMPQQMRDAGMPSVWANYITVDDVDALVSKVTAAGGTVVAPPFDIFEDGRMMTIADPAGAQVALWQPKNSIGAGMVNGQGAMIWNELASSDIDASKAFFSTLFGWTYEKDPNMDYYMIMNNGRMNGGIMPMDKEAETPSFWMAYFNVKDIDATVAKVKTHGGQVVTEIIDSPPGRMAVILDPTGAAISAMQATQVDPWLEHTPQAE
jgi:predicted enzyme related to lactoylglutathione lyase